MRSTIERRDRRPNGRAQPPSSPPEDSIDAGPFSGYAAILGLSLIALIALAAIHLFPYVTHNYRYPTGWDAPSLTTTANGYTTASAGTSITVTGNTITVGGLTLAAGAPFTITYGNQTTAAISWNATPATLVSNIQAQLNTTGTNLLMHRSKGDII